MQSKGSLLLLLGTLHSNRDINNNTKNKKIKKTTKKPKPQKTLPHRFKKFHTQPLPILLLKDLPGNTRTVHLAAPSLSQHLLCASLGSLGTAGVPDSWPRIVFLPAVVSLTSTGTDRALETIFISFQPPLLSELFAWRIKDLGPEAPEIQTTSLPKA